MNGKIQHFNQLLSEAGLPAYVPDADTELEAETIAGSNAETDETLEPYAGYFAQAYAAEILESNQSAWDIIGELPGVEIPEDTTRLEGREPTPATLWVIIDRPPYQRIAIPQLSDYRAVAEEQLARVHFCMADVSKRCAGKLEAVAVANELVAPGQLQPLELVGELDDRVVFDRAKMARKLAGLRSPELPFTTRYFRHKRGQFVAVSKVCSVCGDLLRDNGPAKDVGRQFGTVTWLPDGLETAAHPETAINRPDPLKRQPPPPTAS